MTQLNIATTSIGWGPLKGELLQAQEYLREVSASEILLRSKQDTLHSAVNKLNEERRKRVLTLLAEEGRAICLVHKLIFPKSVPGDWLAPDDSVKLVRMVHSWQTNYRVGDGDDDWQDKSRQYDSTACATCLDLFDRATINDPSRGRHTTMKGVGSKVGTREELYTDEIIDTVSAGYFEMPVVTLETLENL